MSLRLWLPLNGDTRNQGLSGITMAGSPNSWGAGNLGKCATFTGNVSNIVYNNTSEFNYTDNFSWSAWVNTNYTGTATQFIFTVGRADCGGYGYGLSCASTSAVTVWYGSSTWSVNVTGGAWTHLAVTKSGTVVKIYKNGTLYSSNTFSGTAPTYSDGNGVGVGCFHYSGNLYPYYGSICDFRIYDNCLSLREIKEIAKGLYVHYPLSDIYPTSSVNKYSGSAAEGLVTSKSSDITATKLDGERGYRYKMSYTGTGGNAWNSMGFPVFSFVAGKKYDWSCKIRCISCTSNVNFTMRCARMGNDWECPASKQPVNSSLADGEWHEYHGSATLAATSTRSGTTYTTAPLMEFYTNSMSTSGAVYSFEFDLKDVTISECDSNATSSDGALADTTIYDTSGFKNNGTVTSTSKPAWNIDSPRHQGSYVFNGSSSYIDCGASFIAQGQTALTISVWGYSSDWTTFNRLYSCTEGGGFNTELVSSKMCFALHVYTDSAKTASAYTSAIGDGSGYLAIPCSALSAGWHMFTFKYDMASGTTCYLDGVQYAKGTFTSYGAHYNTSAHLYLGCEATGSGGSSPYFAGRLSDFRMYGTALSDADIKELYNTPITVSNNGVLMTQGEFKEE